MIKSNLQTDGLRSQGVARKYSGALDCARQLYGEHGLKAFARGLTPTLIRFVLSFGVGSGGWLLLGRLAGLFPYPTVDWGVPSGRVLGGGIGKLMYLSPPPLATFSADLRS